MDLQGLAIALLDNSCSNPSDKFTGYNVYRVELHCAIATIPPVSAAENGTLRRSIGRIAKRIRQ